MVEFALGAIILFTVIFGIFEFGRMIFAYSLVSGAARDAARYGAVQPQDVAGIMAHAQDYALGLGPALVVVVATPSGDRVEVTVSYNYTAVLAVHFGADYLVALRSRAPPASTAKLSKESVHDRQKGQTLVLVALMMVVLLGMVALALDGGHAYLERRQMQTAADAGALAAVKALCAGERQLGRCRPGLLRHPQRRRQLCR